MEVPKKPRITEVTPHLICALCGGYLIDATTIVECLHSFCKTCIVRYLESSKYCPICEVLVHKTKPLQNIRLDHTLQDIVYKLVPGLFKGEMGRRREYYRDSPTIRSKNSRNAQQRQRVIYSADEMFSIGLQFCPDGRIPSSAKKKNYLGNSKLPADRRFLLCPAGTTISHLKKLLTTKYGLPHNYQIGMFHEQGTVRDHYTLMDVAYIYSWNRTGVLALYYHIHKDPAAVVPKIELTEASQEPVDVKREPVVSDPEPHCKPPSSLCAPSLLGTNCCDHNLPHDLSPLELIATVANDISCLEQGRGLKRNADSAGLYYDHDEESASECQMRKSIEHAIEVCYTSNQETTDSGKHNGEPKLCVDPEITPSVGNQPNQPSSESTIVPAVNTSLPLPNSSLTIVSSSNPHSPVDEKSIMKSKSKPKTTETASQCDPRPKKQKTSETTDKNSTHSRNAVKQTKPVKQTAVVASNHAHELDTKDIPLKIVENNNIDTETSHEESHHDGNSNDVSNQKSHLSQMNGVCKPQSTCPPIISSPSKGKS